MRPSGLSQKGGAEILKAIVPFLSFFASLAGVESPDPSLDNQSHSDPVVVPL